MIDKLANDIARAAQYKLACLGYSADMEKQAGIMDSIKGITKTKALEQKLRTALQGGASEIDNILNLTDKSRTDNILSSLSGLLTSNPVPGLINLQTYGMLDNIDKAGKTLKDTLGASSDTLTNLVQGLKNRGTALGAAGLGAGALGGLGAGYLMGSND